MSKKDEKDPATLSAIFDNAFKMFNCINNTQEPTNSSKVQADVRRTMRMFEDATKLVSMVDMFSSNETFEEVATENIKYFLLPALLGKLTTKMCGVDDRLHLVKVTEIYFTDFLKRLKAYGLTDVEIPEIDTADETKESEDNQDKLAKDDSSTKMLEDMVIHRNAKLQRYRQEKELESRLETLKTNLDNPNIDDEIKREYFVTLLKLYILQIIEELKMLVMEKTILENMKKAGPMDSFADSQKSQKQRFPSASKLQPIIITRDKLQKQVFGAGYPSLPVLTVDEFYEKRVQDGDWPDPSQRNKIGSRCLQDMANKSTNADDDDEAIQKEKMEEEDNPEYLEQARAMDEYKDTHRRGWGNRANRS